MSSEFEVGVVVCSDTVDFITDDVGKLLIDLSEARGWNVVAYEVVPRERMMISAAILRFIDDVVVDIVFSCGGTGPSDRDVAPEATQDIAERDALPHIAQIVRLGCECAKGAPEELFRGIAARHGKTVIVNLPYSEAAIRVTFAAVADALERDAETAECRGSLPS